MTDTPPTTEEKVKRICGMTANGEDHHPGDPDCICAQIWQMLNEEKQAVRRNDCKSMCRLCFADVPVHYAGQDIYLHEGCTAADPLVCDSSPIRALDTGKERKMEETQDAVEFHACMTGDCPHRLTEDCLQAAIQREVKADARVEKLITILVAHTCTCWLRGPSPDPLDPEKHIDGCNFRGAMKSLDNMENKEKG